MTASALPSARQRWRPSASTARYLAAFRTPKGIVAGSVILVLILLALLAPMLFPAGYDVQTDSTFLPPSLAHLFGTDELGRDIFTRSVYGLRTDISLVVIGVPVAMVIGTMLGLIGFVSEGLGTVVQRMLDIILGFPSLVLGICIVLVLGADWLSLLIAIVIYSLPGFGRLARSALVLQQRQEYVLAARTLGVAKWQIMLRHILPNAMDPIVVQAAISVPGAIFIEAGLSIVGLGIQPPVPSLGSLLNVGMSYVNESPTYVLGPTLLLLFLALAFSLLADALNRTVNRK